MKLIPLLSVTLASLPYALAQSQTWWQCGGFSYAGPTTCYPGVNCVIWNDHYSQCIPDCAVPVSTTTGVTVTPAPTTTATTTSGTSATPTTTKLAATGGSIRALDGWATGSYLQKASSSDAAILGPPTSARFNPGNSIRLVIYTGQCATFPYLNVKVAETSYKPLAFEAVGTTFDWNVNGPEGTLSTQSGYNSFLACSDGAVYLQTGFDVPSGNCTATRLKMGLS